MVIPKMETSKGPQQNYLDQIFEARGFCSLCRRLVTRSFPKRVISSEEEISRVMDQENIQLEPAPHVHIYWIDKNFCVRRVEGIRIRDDGLKTQTRVVSETLHPYKEGNVVLLGDNYLSSFNSIGGFLIRNGSTIIEAMPKVFDYSLVTKYSADQDITVSILPAAGSNVSNLSGWAKVLVKAIESCHSDVDANCIWLTLSYGDANAGRNPVAVEAVGCALVDKNPLTTPSLAEAKKRGLGPIDLNKIEILGEPIEDVKIKIPKQS
jgi:hypothetical protein